MWITQFKCVIGRSLLTHSDGFKNSSQGEQWTASHEDGIKFQVVFWILQLLFFLFHLLSGERCCSAIFNNNLLHEILHKKKAETTKFLFRFWRTRRKFCNIFSCCSSSGHKFRGKNLYKHKNRDRIQWKTPRHCRRTDTLKAVVDTQTQTAFKMMSYFYLFFFHLGEAKRKHKRFFTVYLI